MRRFCDKVMWSYFRCLVGYFHSVAMVTKMADNIPKLAFWLICSYCKIVGPWQGNTSTGNSCFIVNLVYYQWRIQDLSGGWSQPINWPTFAESCMKMRKTGGRGVGRTSKVLLWDQPLIFDLKWKCIKNLNLKYLNIAHFDRGQF